MRRFDPVAQKNSLKRQIFYWTFPTQVTTTRYTDCIASYNYLLQVHWLQINDDISSFIQKLYRKKTFDHCKCPKSQIKIKFGNVFFG